MKNKTIKKLAKKTGLSEEDVVHMLAEQSLRDNGHYKKLESVDLELDDDLVKFLEKLAKILKVEISTVITVALLNLEGLNVKVPRGRGSSTRRKNAPKGY